MHSIDHHETSLAHLAAVVQTAHHLDALHEGPRVDRAEVAKAYDTIRQGLKISEVHALLAVAEAIESLGKPNGPVTM